MLTSCKWVAKFQPMTLCACCVFSGTLGEQWQQYEAFYEELSQWIKDTESEMKSDSELKATLEQKTIQLEKQKVRDTCTVVHQVHHSDSAGKITGQSVALAG